VAKQASVLMVVRLFVFLKQLTTERRKDTISPNIRNFFAGRTAELLSFERCLIAEKQSTGATVLPT